jgi:hypothetical protein
MEAGRASTRMESANLRLRPRRALQTRQMNPGPFASSLISWSSTKPSSRSLSVNWGSAESCLMHTTVPALTRLKGQTLGPAQRPSTTTRDWAGACFTGGQRRPKKTPLQEGFPGNPDIIALFPGPCKKSQVIANPRVGSVHNKAEDPRWAKMAPQ